MQPEDHAIIDRSSFDNVLVFDPKHEVFNGMHLYGCKLGNVSYMVSFDEMRPSDKWRASWQREGQKTTFLRRGYDTLGEALDALRKIARRHAA